MQLFLSVYVDDVKMAGKTQNMPKMWATLPKTVDLEDLTSPLDQENLGCTQRAAQVKMEDWFSKQISINTGVDKSQRHHSL